MVEGGQEKSNFRISSKRLFLTYSRVNSKISAQKLLELLQEKPQLRGTHYVIAKEEHRRGGLHYHAIITTDKKFEIRNARVLDVKYGRQTFHGNYQPIKNLQATVEYVCKGGGYITNLPNLVEGKLLSEKEFLVRQVEEKGVAKALLDYTKNNPEKAFSSRSVSALKKNFKDIQELENSVDCDNLESPFQIDNFNLQGKLKEWVENPEWHKNKALILVGPSGVGKTQFGTVFCMLKKLKTLVVQHKEDFQRLKRSHDAIIVDDANVGEFEKTQLLALLDNATPRTIRVMYQTVRKKKEIVTIILMNHAQFQEVCQTLEQGAFLRRAVVHRPQIPFMINVNINIHNYRDVIHNYNPPLEPREKNTFDQRQQKEQELMRDNYREIQEIKKEYELEKAERRDLLRIH